MLRERERENGLRDHRAAGQWTEHGRTTQSTPMQAHKPVNPKPATEAGVNPRDRPQNGRYTARRPQCSRDGFACLDNLVREANSELLLAGARQSNAAAQSSRAFERALLPVALRRLLSYTFVVRWLCQPARSPAATSSSTRRSNLVRMLRS